MTGFFPEAILRPFEEGMKALSGGDISGVIMHLQLAGQSVNCGIEEWLLKFTTKEDMLMALMLPHGVYSIFYFFA